MTAFALVNAKQFESYENLLQLFVDQQFVINRLCYATLHRAIAAAYAFA